MQRAEPVIIHTKEDFNDFTSRMLFISGVVVTRVRPNISLVFETHEDKYLDFTRVVMGEKHLMMNSIYHPLYALDSLYLCGTWKFMSPVHMTMDFIIPVEKYREALIPMTEEEFIGLSFIDDISKGDSEGYDVIAVPAIPREVIYVIMLLDRLQMVTRADSETKAIAVEMLR